MLNLLRCLALLVGSCCAPLLALAHHSFAVYSDEITEVEGTLTSVRWGNPHVSFELESADGTTWVLEGAAVYVLERRDLTRDLFQVGNRIRAAGRQHRTAEQIWLLNVQLSDERELLMVTGAAPRWSDDTFGSDGRLADTRSTRENRTIFRVWSRPELRPIDYGDNLPYRNPRPAGGLDWIARLDAFAGRCEPVGMPGIMATPYPVEFIDHGNFIQLLGFSNNAVIDRRIHLNADSESTASAPDRMGYSLGRWETSNRLVVETSDIAWPYFDDSLGTPQSEVMQTVETFTLSDDSDRLDYEMTVNDEATFTDSVTVIDISWSSLGESRAQPTNCSN